jgi:lysophospholipase
MFQYENGGPGIAWSSIGNLPAFMNASIPMPLITSDGRAPHEILVSLNTTVFEFTPWELGSWDPTVFGFVPLNYLGTNFTDGVVPDGEQCYTGFDQAGYVIGTSSTLFNQVLLTLGSKGPSAVLGKAVTEAAKLVSKTDDDIAEYRPNPFFGYNKTGHNVGATSDHLTLVDGGEDLQNIPFHPLIQPERKVDVIFAIDSSADTTTYWPNGTSLVATYERAVGLGGLSNGTVFPSIPDTNTFINLKLNQHPTFFGCNSSNMTGPSPIIVYIPNFPYNFMSNVSTFDLQYSGEERDSIITNGYNVATLANSTEDAVWPTCVGCAIIARSLERNGQDLPQACTDCFTKHCWDGSLAPQKPSGSYDPSTISNTSANASSTDNGSKKSASPPPTAGDLPSWLKLLTFGVIAERLASFVSSHAS